MLSSDSLEAYALPFPFGSSSPCPSSERQASLENGFSPLGCAVFSPHIEQMYRKVSSSTPQDEQSVTMVGGAKLSKVSVAGSRKARTSGGMVESSRSSNVSSPKSLGSVLSYADAAVLFGRPIPFEEAWNCAAVIRRLVDERRPGTAR